MGFEGYLYKFNLNASHSLLIENTRGAVHPHTFIVSLFVKIDSADMMLYDEVEKIVSEFLDVYNGKELNSLSPFDQVEPTIENIGDFLFSRLKGILQHSGILLNKLEISETPARVYIVSKNSTQNVLSNADSDYDNNKINKLIVHSVIDSAAKDMVKKPYYIKRRKEEKQKELERKIEASHNKGEIKEKPLEGLGENEEIFNVEKAEENLEEKGIAEEEALKEKSAEEEKEDKAEKRKFVLPKTAVAVLILCIFTLGLTLYLGNRSDMPLGIDTYGHMFKSDFLYKSIKEGNFYPLFSKYWYNGIQPFRYWAPLPYYILAFLQFFAGGSAVNAYVAFIGFMFFLGGLGWLLWGIEEKRVTITLVFGILWFFMPENLRVLFFEGNIPRVVIAALIPFLFYFLWRFLEKDKRYSIIPMSVFMLLIIMCHLMVAAMLGITSFIFLLTYSIVFKKFVKPLQIIIAMLLCFAVAGIWLYPALQGGLVSMTNDATSEVMRALSTPFTISLNPFIRLTSLGRSGYFYFGISIVITAVLGIFLANKKSLPGFITVIIIFLGTTTAFIPVLLKMPLNQLLWMMRFTPIAYGILIMSLINWTKCKRAFMAILLILIIVDSSLSFNLSMYPSEKSSSIEKILGAAKEITKQRLALLDSSTFGSYPSFYICSMGEKESYAYGWAWQGASTAQNIVFLNTALENGYYSYLFDRSLEMGCDTVVIKKGSLEKKKSSFKLIDTAAKALKYSLYKETEEGYVYHRETPESFGVITEYTGLCIGHSASEIPLEYPGFKIGASDNLEDYSINELKKYSTLYLSDFTYKNRAKAEKMISKLSSLGVKIIIDMNRIPTDPDTNRMIFMGVTAQPITFDNKLPDLFYNGKKYKSVGFKKEYKKWNTVYLQNVPKETGFAWMKDKKLTFMGNGSGTGKNITFLGFNLMFHSMTNEDNQTLDIMNKAINKELQKTPKRTIVPLDIKYNKNSINIISPRKNVDTTIAFLDSYKSSSRIYSDQNLLNVEAGETDIKVTYPYFTKGLIVSLIGMLGFAVLLVFIYRGGKYHEKTS